MADSNVHIVKPGETWLSIANLYNVNVFFLMKKNARRRGISTSAPGYENRPTFEETNYALHVGMLVYIYPDLLPKKNKTQSIMFDRKNDRNINGKPFVTVKAQKKLDFDLKMILPNPRETRIDKGTSLRKPSITDFLVNEAISMPNEKKVEIMQKVVKFGLGHEIHGSSAKEVFKNLAKDTMSNPGRFILKNASPGYFVFNPYNYIVVQQPELAEYLEDRVPIVAGVNAEYSAFNASGSVSVNLFNGQVFAGGGVSDNTKKGVDPRPNMPEINNLSLILIQQRHLKNPKTGKVTRQSAAEGADGIIGGTSAGGFVGFRGILVGADYNYPSSPEEDGKWSFKLGIGPKKGVDVGAGVSHSEPIFKPFWPANYQGERGADEKK